MVPLTVVSREVKFLIAVAGIYFCYIYYSVVLERMCVSIHTDPYRPIENSLSNANLTLNLNLNPT